MAISKARTIAFDILHRVATQDSYADELLRAALDETVGPEDAGLATQLTLGVLRWQRLLDFLIERDLTKKKALDIEVRLALRLGMYQLWFLARVPPHAAVHESVELVKRARKRSAAVLVNAILRKAAKEAAQFGRSSETSETPSDRIDSFVPQQLPLAERLGILYSHPTWMVERWIGNFGEEQTRALLLANNRVPALSGYLLDAQRRQEAETSLKNAGCVIEPGVLLRDAWTLHGGNPAKSEAVQRGWVVIQDEASQAVAHALSVEAGQSVLDLCAAPGGKTLLLARAAGPHGHVLATDLHEHRVRAMTSRFENAGIRNIETRALDGTQPLAPEQQVDRQVGQYFDRVLFDRVLVDAPCSGTGTLARHPEIRWRLEAGVSQNDLAELHALQVRLLRNALEYLTPAGLLVYSTCSLEPEENERVVQEALGSAPGRFRAVTPAAALRDALRQDISLESLTGADGFFRTYPPAQKTPSRETDGFFAATIARTHEARTHEA